jgi:KDO2-lipid IV(A) lauroyltransferase
MIKYFLFKLIRGLVLVLPRKWSYWIGCRVAEIEYFRKVKTRRIVKANLSNIMSLGSSGPVDDSEISKQAKAVFRNFAKYLVDFFFFANLDGDQIKKLVNVKGIQNMHDAFKKGKGVIGITAHLGNWELGGVVTSLFGFNVNAVALSHENTKINRLFVNQRSAKGINVIPVGSDFNKYLSVLRKNQFIALVGDRLTSDAGIKINFFNKTAVIPKGPAVLSLRTGAPIVPAFMIRNPDDTFDFVFEDLIEPSDLINAKTGSVEVLSKKIVSVMETYISKYPEQWFLFYNIWTNGVGAVK